MRIQFCGADRTVTGSCHLIEVNGLRLLLDLGLYQGPRDSNRNNRSDRLYCGDLMVGDYIFVQEAAKRTEQAYDAYYISCEQDRNEGPDNSNDNDDDIDPNCTHI